MADLTSDQEDTLIQLTASGRWHISETPVAELRDRSPEEGFKPKGLWYGVGSSWIEWTVGERFMNPKPSDYLVEVGEPNPAVLFISTLLEFEEFEDDWLVGSSIDWRGVMMSYWGIEISSYFWQKRLSSNWYYPWDVASGCIWRSEAIKVVSCRQIGEVV